MAKTTSTVIKQLTTLFWRNGYAQTAISDILAATGLSQSQFYRQFHTKQAAFLQSLTAYQAMLQQLLTKTDAQAKANREPLPQRLVRLLLVPTNDEQLPAGCLLVNTMAEFSPADSLVHAQTEAIYSDLQTQFVKVLASDSHLKNSGELAATLVVLRNGYQLRAKQGVSYQQLKQQATVSVTNLITANQ